MGNIAGKLFGAIGNPQACYHRLPCDRITACPGYAWWYSLQLAKAYERSTHRVCTSPFRPIIAPAYDLPLAA